MRTGVIKCVKKKRWQRKDASLQTTIFSHCLPEWGRRNVQFTFFKGIIGTLAVSKSTFGIHSNIIRNSNSQMCRLSFAHLIYHCDNALWPNRRNKGSEETVRKRLKYFWILKNPAFRGSHRYIWKTNIWAVSIDRNWTVTRCRNYHSFPFILFCV